jgi:hypothetical protein
MLTALIFGDYLASRELKRGGEGCGTVSCRAKNCGPAEVSVGGKQGQVSMAFV